MANAKKNVVANFGTISNLKKGRAGKNPMVRFTLTGGAKGQFSREVQAYGSEKVDAITAIGNGGQIWVRGELKTVNRNGGAYSEDVLHAWNVKDNTKREEATSEDTSVEAEAEAQAEADAAADEAADAAADEAVEQDLTAIVGIGEGIAAKLVEAGITNYAALRDASEEALEAAGKGIAARAANGDWGAQAAALADQAADDQAVGISNNIDDEIPF